MEIDLRRELEAMLRTSDSTRLNQVLDALDIFLRESEDVSPEQRRQLEAEAIELDALYGQCLEDESYAESAEFQRLFDLAKRNVLGMIQQK